MNLIAALVIIFVLIVIISALVFKLAIKAADNDLNGYSEEEEDIKPITVAVSDNVSEKVVIWDSNNNVS